MIQFHDSLEEFTFWLGAVIFLGLSITLPSAAPSFLDLGFRPLPLDEKLPPVVEVEAFGTEPVESSYQIEALMHTGVPLLEQLVSMANASISDQEESSSEGGRKAKTVERMKESAEPPRPPLSPSAPGTPSALQITQ
jgi:hypothetical protein